MTSAWHAHTSEDHPFSPPFLAISTRQTSLVIPNALVSQGLDLVWQTDSSQADWRTQTLSEFAHPGLENPIDVGVIAALRVYVHHEQIRG